MAPDPVDLQTKVLEFPCVYSEAEWACVLMLVTLELTFLDDSQRKP